MEWMAASLPRPRGSCAQDIYRSSGFNPVFLAMRASMAGPNSSLSANAQV